MSRIGTPIRNAMANLRSFLIAAVILAASVGLAALLVSLAPEPARTEPPPQIPFAQTARVTAGSGAIPVYGGGTVRPSAEIAVAPQVGGRVVWVDPAFQSGGRVKAGQTLFRLEEADYLYRVQEARASLAARRVALLQEEERAAIARGQFELYSQRQGDTPSPPAANPLTLREPQLEAARAALGRDEALLAAADLALSRTRVTAPFDGFVREESVDVGQIVAPGQPVGRLFAADAVEVVVPVTNAEAELISGLWELGPGDGDRRVGARVVARYGGGTHAWKGYVDRGETSVDERTRTVDVIVRVPDPFAGSNPPLLVGAFVEVEIEGLRLDRYFKVPRAALRPGNEVWLAGEGGWVSIVPVQVLQRADDQVFVLGNLAPGQAVITGGLQFATEGMRVLTEAAPAP